VTSGAEVLDSSAGCPPGTLAATNGDVRFVVALLVLSLGVGVSPRGSEARPRVAQAAAPSVTTDRALAAVDRDQRDRAQAAAERAALTTRYERELAEIDRLKRQKASWRRDRQIRAAMASSLETAKTLATVTARLRDAEARLDRDRRALVAAVDAELIAGVGTSPAAAARRTRLVAARAAARSGAGARPHKIVLPDDQLDPLADPEELDQQAAALRDSEAELARQVDSLARQAARFRRMGDLRQQHERAGVLALRDDEGPRRNQARSAAPAADSPREGAGGGDSPAPPGDGPLSSDDAPAPPTPPSSGGSPFESFDGEPTVVLSDVVDGPTIDALRRAERSADPSAKAAAAELARVRVAERLRLLRERRAAIERRARELRAPR